MRKGATPVEPTASHPRHTNIFIFVAFIVFLIFVEFSFVVKFVTQRSVVAIRDEIDFFSDVATERRRL